MKGGTVEMFTTHDVGRKEYPDVIKLSDLPIGSTFRLKYECIKNITSDGRKCLNATQTDVYWVFLVGLPGKASRRLFTALTMCDALGNIQSGLIPHSFLKPGAMYSLQSDTEVVPVNIEIAKVPIISVEEFWDSNEKDDDFEDDEEIDVEDGMEHSTQYG